MLICRVFINQSTCDELAMPTNERGILIWNVYVNIENRSDIPTHIRAHPTFQNLPDALKMMQSNLFY